jgi:hypothetical protein
VLSLRQKYLAALARLLPAGLLGASLTLGAATPGSAAREGSIENQPGAAAASVSDRLSAIREAVSEIVGSEVQGKNLQTAWGNWRNGWHNWRNGGWRNGGWHNSHNWHNWHNY